MPPPVEAHRPRVLAVASGGGHWVQLLRLMPAFEGADVTFVTVDRAYRADVPDHARFEVINDATRWNKWGLLRMALRLGVILLRRRPDIVISTGAAPGYFAIRMGRLLGAKTLWIDSIANAESVSLTGHLVARHADEWLTQWPHLVEPDGPRYEGGVL